ncbi:MAG: N-acetylmuramoyl-L-alanine amidase [Verrucomicrobia bacterium]|nr:N-acetylmuramoyl-L-alanine amidase [Verrucomicrobiota bacterium]
MSFKSEWMGVGLVWFCAAQMIFGAPDYVIIDPGHGGIDRGGMPGQRIPEKGLALDTARRLRRVLAKTGRVRPIMTRSSDVFVPLNVRTAIANRYAGKNAVFVSIHYNAGERVGAYGIETYYYNPRARLLAQDVQRRVIEAMDSIDRGVWQRGFFVLRRNRLPAILVECGFLTNPEEARRALDPVYRQRTAEAVARAILDY